MKKITIRGIIGWSENATPVFLENAIAEAKGEDLEIEFSSPGGYVMPGLEMANMIRNYPGKVTAKITGLAASMSSYIPMMADEVIAEDNAIYMIHNVFGGMYGGDYRDAEKLAKHLKAMRDLLAKAYVNKTGKDKTKIYKMMDDETYLYGQEIVDEGFADIMVEAADEKEKDEAVALATAEIDDCIAKMKENEDEVKADFEKAAAYLKTEPINKTETPAAGGNKPTGEVTKMTLKEQLAADPAMKAEYDADIASAKSEGEATGRTDASKAWDAAAPILASETYPQAVKDRVIAKAQKCDHEGLLDFVALHDMSVEGNKQEKAEGEQSSDTKPEAPTSLKKAENEGLVTGDDVEATAKAMREG